MMVGNKHLFYFLLLYILVIGIFFRLWKFPSVPISLHGDEVGVGYNAYTLLHWGSDEVGKHWPFVFRADVTPMIFYATIPSIFIFGPTDGAIRFPSVVVGVLTLISFYFFCNEYTLFELRLLKFRRLFILLCITFLAINPWHIQLSRITHDAGYSLFVQILAFGLFFRGLRFQSKNIILLACIVFGFSFYSYHAPRLTTPLLIIGLYMCYRKKMAHFMSKRFIIFSLSILFLITLPIVLDFALKPIGQTRFGGINIFIRDPHQQNSFITIGSRLLLSVANQFNLRTLFFDASTARYFNTSNVGLFYYTDLLLCIIALFVLPRRIRNAVCAVSLIAILPGALTSGPPNFGRIILLLPCLVFLSSYATHYLIITSNNKRLIIQVFVIMLITQLVFFSYSYYIQSPLEFYSRWQYGTRQATAALKKYENVARTFIVSENIKQAYIYVLFYGQKTLPSLLSDSHRIYQPNLGYRKFQNYQFRMINWEQDQKIPNAVFLANPTEIDPIYFKEKILAPDGTILYGIVTTLK